MKKRTGLFSALVFISFFLSQCIGVSNIAETSGVNSSYLEEIPENAEKVVLRKSNVTPNSLFEEVITVLISESHRIERKDEKRYYITTEGKDVGESTHQRMSIFIRKDGADSIMEITTDWRQGTQANAMATALSGVLLDSNWQKAKWETSSRLGIAFAESVSIAQQIENAIISYE